MSLLDDFVPRTPDDYICSISTRKQIESFFITWLNKHPMFNAMLLWGHPGVGKTSLVYAYETEYNLNILKYNVSMLKKSEIKDIIQATQRTQDVYERNTIILLDESDNCADWDTVKEIIKHTRVPIILTANWVNKIPKNIDNLLEIEIPYPRETQKIKLLQRINTARNLGIEDEKLVMICDVCKTYRGCIIALQKAIINNTWRKIERPTEDLGPEDELLKMYHGEQVDSNWEIGDFIKYSLVNNVDYKDLGVLKTIEKMSRETSLGTIPHDYMMLCRSNVNVIRRPPWYGNYKKDYVKKEKKTDEKIEFKTTKEKKVVKKVSKIITAEELW